MLFALQKSFANAQWLYIRRKLTVVLGFRKGGGDIYVHRGYDAASLRNRRFLPFWDDVSRRFLFKDRNVEDKLQEPTEQRRAVIFQTTGRLVHPHPTPFFYERSQPFGVPIK